MPPHRRDASRPVVAVQLERLFAVVRPPDEPGRPWRNSEVVAACRRAGMELSESHLSELRRGIKLNPTMRVLETLAWFFEVRTGYFTDAGVAAEVELELASRADALDERVRADQQAAEDHAAARHELEQVMRRSGATRAASRGFDRAQSRRQASMMRALARALESDSDQASSGESGPGGPAGPTSTADLDET